MPYFWRMPCKPTASFEYKHGWMMATAERWKFMKEVRGPYRHVTKWFFGHAKKLRPNPNAQRDRRRWKAMGYE